MPSPKSKDVSGWVLYSARDFGFCLSYPPDMEVKANPGHTAEEGIFDLFEWRIPEEDWFVVLHVHRVPADMKTMTMREWLEYWGGVFEETTIDGDVPAILRTWLFEAVYEKSVFFRQKSADEVVEIRLVVPNIVDWMGPMEKVEPQYRDQEILFDRMVKSIHFTDCSPTS